MPPTDSVPAVVVPAVEPEVTEPEVTEPVVEEPEMALEEPEPAVLEPETSVEPDASPFDDVAPSIDKTEPPITEPMIEEPAITEPEATDPEASSNIDDLFGEPATPVDPETADMLTEPEMASEPEVTPEPSSDIDSLFGTEPATEPATESDLPEAETAAESADEPMVDDGLFGEPTAPADEVEEPAPTEGEDTSLDSLFKTEETPAADPIDPPAPAADEADLDELFGKPINTDSTDSTTGDSVVPTIDSKLPNQVPAVEGTSPDDDSALDALFGVGASAPAPKFDGAEFRKWVDNTGAYSVNARLAVIHTDKVKLIKENGSFTTVQLARLSEADFGYVQWVASSMTNESASMLVKKDASTADSESTR